MRKFIQIVLHCKMCILYPFYRCKVTKEAPYAIFKRPLSYNASHTSKYDEKTDGSKPAVSERHHVTEIKEANPPRKTPKIDHKCVSKDPPRGDTFFRKKTKGCKRGNRKLSTIAPLLNITVSSFKTSLSSETKEKGYFTKTSLRKGLFAHTTVHPVITTDSYLKATSTTQTTALLSERLQLTATARSVRKHQIKSGDAFLPQKEKSPLTTTSSPATAAKELDVTRMWTTTIHSHKRDSLERQVGVPTYYNNATTKFKTQHFNRKNREKVHFTGTNTNQVLSSGSTALKQSKALLNETSEYMLSCCLND